MAFQGAPELWLITDPSGFLGSGGAAVAFAADLELGWARLPEALHGETEGSVLDFGIEDAADGVSFRRPQMQQALVVFPGDGVLRLGEIKSQSAVFEHDRARGLAEEVLHGAGEGVGGHMGIVHIPRVGVCDE
jgi:hypothetical protein